MYQKLAYLIYKLIYFVNKLIFFFLKKDFLLTIKPYIEKDNYRKITIRNKKINFFIPNRLIDWRVQTLFYKEPETIEWINNFEKKKIVFWDIGANIGLYSIYCAIIHPKSKIIAFEPSTNNLRVISRNVAINSLFKQISIFPNALSDKDNQFLYLNESSGIEGSAHNNYGLSQKNNISYSTYGTSIDSLYNNKILSCPNYIKIDVDGIENLILKGAKDILINRKLREISIEINENEKNKKNYIFKLLKKNNFLFIQKKNNQNFIEKDIDKKTYNFLFKRS